MIVYNVQRRWFTDKGTAEAHRIAMGLKPSHTLKIEVQDRAQLRDLLNALCDPPEKGKPVADPATDTLVDRAYVKPGTDIPDFIPQFLRKD